MKIGRLASHIVAIVLFSSGWLYSQSLPSPGGGAAAPTTEVAVVSLFDGSVEGQVSPTNFGASKAITIVGSGEITNLCVIFLPGALTEADDGVVYFFDSDPNLTIDAANLTAPVVRTVVANIRVTTENFDTQFASGQVACLYDLGISFHGITHVAWLNTDVGTLTNENIEIHLWRRQDL